MDKYRKKPVYVEAEQWFEAQWLADANAYHLDVSPYRKSDSDNLHKACEHCGVTMNYHGWLLAHKGGQPVCPGAWIVKGREGKVYAVKSEIFDQVYEKVEESSC